MLGNVMFSFSLPHFDVLSSVTIASTSFDELHGIYIYIYYIVLKGVRLPSADNIWIHLSSPFFICAIFFASWRVHTIFLCWPRKKTYAKSWVSTARAACRRFAGLKSFILCVIFLRWIVVKKSQHKMVNILNI